MSERGKNDPLRDELDQLFADLWNASSFAGHRRGFRPAVDSYRCDDPPRLFVVIELAGVDPQAIQIVLHDRTLLVAGERARPVACGRRYQQMEIDYGHFHRRIHLHEHVDPDAVAATYEQGLLTIVLPITTKAAGPVQVPIQLRSKQ